MDFKNSQKAAFKPNWQVKSVLNLKIPISHEVKQTTNHNYLKNFIFDKLHFLEFFDPLHPPPKCQIIKIYFLNEFYIANFIKDLILLLCE